MCCTLCIIVILKIIKNMVIYKITNQINKKIWTLKGKIIDINNYKPVSTISESGE